LFRFISLLEAVKEQSATLDVQPPQLSSMQSEGSRNYGRSKGMAIHAVGITTEAQPDDQPDETFRVDMLKVLPRLQAFARVLTRNREAAEDLLQDTVVRALRAHRSFQPGSNMLAWLCTILRNQHISGLRRRRHEAMPIEDLPDSAASVGPSQYDSIAVGEIRRALMKLSPEHREVLVMVAAAGLSYGEAAEICGCAVGTVKSRVNRARNELRRLLATGEHGIDAGELLLLAA
jgi:RNA polymerase sigma-70 factor (ECF subfamily)